MSKIQKLPKEAYNEDSITDTFFSGKTRQAVAALALTLTALSAQAQNQIVNQEEITANDTYANVSIVCLNDKPFDINKFIVNDTGKIGLQFEPNSMEPIVGWGVEKNPNLQASLDSLCNGTMQQANEQLRIKINDDMSATVSISINEVNRTYNLDDALEVSDVNMVNEVSPNYQMKQPNLTEKEITMKMFDLMHKHSDLYMEREGSMPENTKFEMILSQYISDIESFNPQVLQGVDLENDNQELVIEKMNANFEVKEDKYAIQDYLFMKAQKEKEKTELTQKEKEIINTEFEMPNFGKDDKVVKNTSSTQKRKI